jgi:hypothetical protein
MQAVTDGRILLAHDLNDNLAKADKFEADFVKNVDEFIAKNEMDFPEETLRNLRDGYNTEDVGELSLKEANITSVIWATGYGFDFGMVRLPVFDSDGFPIQTRGATRVVITGRRRREGRSLLLEIVRNGGCAAFIQAHLSRPEEVRRIVPFVIKTYGRLDYAFNNAGTPGDNGRLLEQTEKNFDHIFSVNVKAVFLLLQDAGGRSLCGEQARGVGPNQDSCRGIRTLRHPG